MQTIFRRVRSDERGANLVEAVLAVTVLLLLLVAGVGLGRAYHDYIIMANAAREGARFASFYPWNLAGIEAITNQEAADSGMDLAPCTINVVPTPSGDPCTSVQPGGSVSVELQCPFDPLVGGWYGVVPLTLRTRTKMVVFGADVVCP